MVGNNFILIFLYIITELYTLESSCRPVSIIVIYILLDLHNKQRNHSPAIDFLNFFIYIYIYI